MSQNNPLKHVIKRSFQHVAAQFGAQNRTPTEPQLLVLMYHRVLPADDARAQIEEPGMWVTPDTFRKNLHLLSQRFEIVKLSDWLIRKKAGQTLPLKSCAITFDDGWADNYEFAFPILQALNIPATVYLVADMIGTRDMFWPERLARTLTAIARNHPQQWSNPHLDWLRNSHVAYAFSQTPPTREELAQLIDQAKQQSDADIHARLDIIEAELGIATSQEQASLLDWKQVTEMTQSGLIEMGSHTCRHTRLTEETPSDILEHEIIDSKKIIEKHTDQAITSFCYPNGDFSAEACRLVEQNYVGAVTTQSGWNTLKTDSNLLQRIGVHEDIANDETAFLARISGWMSLLTR